MKTSYKSTVNGHFEFELDESQLQQMDVRTEAPDHFHILHQQQSYRVQLLNKDPQKKTFEFLINGRNYSVALDDQYDQLIKKLGLSVASTQQVNDIKAPMPGLVLEVMVETGQQIKKGDGLIILEAMKMENIIKSAGEGTVGRISVKKGNAVEKGQLLIELE